MVDDTTVTYTTNAVANPLVVATIHSNVTLNATGQSEPIYIGGSQHVLLLITLGAKTSTPDVTFHIKVIDGSLGTVVGTYDYATAALSTGNETAAIAVDEASATPLGDYIEVSWSGTLSGTKYFANTTTRLIAK